MAQLTGEVSPNQSLVDGAVGAAPVVSVVIPCFNEASAIGRVVRRARAGLDKLGLPGEIVVVDNGSTDDTRDQARAAGARVIAEPRRGYGCAYRCGFRAARGRYIVMADGDDTYPVDELGPFIAQLDSGYELINGNRFGGGIDRGAMTWSHRYLGTPLLSCLLRLLTGVDLADSQCGMRAFRRELLDRLDLRAPGMEFASEMLLEAARHHVRMCEVPIRLGNRVGTSKLQTVPDGWRHLRYLLIASPNHLFVIPGLILLFLGLLVLGAQTYMPAGVPLVGGVLWKPEHASILLASAGVQVLWFGLLAKLYNAVSRRDGTGEVEPLPTAAFPLERALGVSVMTLVAGIVLEVALALQQAEIIGPHPALGIVSAFAVIVGLQSVFGAFLAYALSSECTRPVVRRARDAEPDPPADTGPQPATNPTAQPRPELSYSP